MKFNVEDQIEVLPDGSIIITRRLTDDCSELLERYYKVEDQIKYDKEVQDFINSQPVLEQ